MSRRAVFAGFAALLAGSGCAHLPARAGAAGLRVMTYNIQSGGGDLSRIAAVIRQASPDLVGLQEVDVHWATRSSFADQAQTLANELGMQVRFAPIYQLAPTNPGEGQREFGVALLSKLPITSWRNDTITRLSTQEPNPVPTPAPGLLEATVDLQGTSVRVFVTHLDYRADPSVRDRQVGDMLRYIGDGSVPTLLFGDLNATPDAAELQALFRRLPDTFPDHGEALTYPAEAPQKRIDYVLASRHFQTVAALIPPTTASDHRPVVVSLRLTVAKE